MCTPLVKSVSGDWGATHARSPRRAKAVEWAWACHDMIDEECFLLNVIKCYYSKTQNIDRYF